MCVWAAGGGVFLLCIGIGVGLATGGKPTRSATQPNEERAGAGATESQKPRREVLKIRVPVSVTVKMITVTKEEGLLLSSNGHYIVSGRIEGKEAKGGEITLGATLGAGESTGRARSGIEELVGQCNSISYFKDAAQVHGVYSPLHMEMVTDDKAETIEGIAEMSFSDKANLNSGNFMYIGHLTNLKRLFLSHTSISDSELVHLGKLRQLRVLYLSETPVTDDGLKHLKELTFLRAISLSKTKVTDNGLKELQRLMPNTKIVN
jgi:hypothetical protein